MRYGKNLNEKTAKMLMEKAEDCFDLAKTQHGIADQQHEIAARQHKNADKLDASARKLDAVGHALEVDAVEITGKDEMVVGRTSPRLLDGTKASH
jgi:hypothetical protein